MAQTKYDYSQTGEDIFYKIIYPVFAREFLFLSNYETFASLVQAKFNLNDYQLQKILEYWEEKEQILTTEK